MKRAIIALIPILALAGCGPKVKVTKRLPPSAIRPVQEAALDTLLERYRAWTESIHTLNATVQLIPTAGSTYSGVIEQYHDVRAFVLAERPAKLRMIGQAPIVHTNIFDMVTDGDTFKISIPSKNKFIVGLNRVERVSKKPIENLRPEHLVEAILPSSLPAGAPGRPSQGPDSGLRTVLEEWDSPPYRYYVVSLLREKAGAAGGSLDIEKKIWFDRADLSVARVQSFAPGGRLVSDVTYADYAAFGQVSYPRSITLWRPRDDYSLALQVRKLVINQPLDAEKFELAQPPGSELVKLEPAKESSR